MLTSTLTEGLKSYSIGEKLRAMRLRKKMGLVELGSHTGLSPALLSKIERGKLFPTLPTLLRIAMVFSVGLEFFFTDDRKRRVLAIARKKERLKFPEKPKDRRTPLMFLRVSISGPWSGSSTPTTPNSSGSTRARSGCTSTPGWNSSTSPPAGWDFVWATMRCGSRTAIPSTSIQMFPTDTGAQAPTRQRHWW